MRSSLSLHDVLNDRQPSTAIMAVAALDPPKGWIFQTPDGAPLLNPPVLGPSSDVQAAVNAIRGWLAADGIRTEGVEVTIAVYGSTDRWTAPFLVPAELVQVDWRIPSSTPSERAIVATVDMDATRVTVSHETPDETLIGYTTHSRDEVLSVQVPVGADGYTERLFLAGHVLAEESGIQPGWLVLHRGQMWQVRGAGISGCGCTLFCAAKVHVFLPSGSVDSFCLRRDHAYTVQVPAAKPAVLRAVAS
jgi:hypothetical protein